MTEPSPRMGISGRLARAFQANPLTPVLALAGLLLGLAGVLITPREEEPQIDVTMANVFVPFAGASAVDVENLVTFPLEQVLSEIEGVKHVYSVSRPGMAAITVEFTVGVPRQEALVRLMIGMIALAGIIVRNSILLVDFINHALAEGQGLDDAVIEACAVRAQPIALTALAAMGGALFILDDPIFNGLAISLIFGIAVSTVLTLMVIPLLYYVLLKRKPLAVRQAIA